MISGTDNRNRESRRRRNLESKKLIGSLVSDSQASEQILAAAKKSRANKLERIRNKLKAGKRLSTSELQYLRERAPDLYEQAARIEFSVLYAAAIERTPRSFRAGEGGKLVSSKREEEKRQDEQKEQSNFLRGLDRSDSFRSPVQSTISGPASDRQKLSIHA